MAVPRGFFASAGDSDSDSADSDSDESAGLRGGAALPTSPGLALGGRPCGNG
jgi:hypothetical protein